MDYTPSRIGKAAILASRMDSTRRLSGSGNPRFSVAALWSMAAQNDEGVEDELTKAQRQLRDMKLKISSQSKRNFILERDVRYLDGRIALLIQNRMALHEQQEVASHLEEVETQEGSLDDRRKQLYGNLFHLLQSEPRHIAGLTRKVTLAEIDTLLQTVMFTLFGNQYETREEYLLLSMFQNVLAAEFEGASNFAGLMRANTPVSRMMTTYTRRGPGQTYLKHILSERVNKLISMHDLDLEINPLKVYEQMILDIEKVSNGVCNLPKSITSEEATQNADVQAIIAPRVQTLMEIGASILSIIMSSIDQIPYGIRWICKQIRSLAKRKFPDSTESQKCSLIGGFFMLRFINPAIVTPQAYMLVDGDPKKNPRRTLTLIAKLIQNLSNKPTHTKEPFMSVLNPFVDHNEARFQRFLNDICEIGDFYEALEMEQYIALSKKEIELNITLNELYSTHQFLYQHIDTLAPEVESHLRICLQDLGPAPNQLPRGDNKIIPLQLFSRWDQTNIDISSNNASDQLTRGEFLYYDAKALFVQILRMKPNIVDQSIVPLDLENIIEAASTARDAQLVRKGLKLGDMLQELVRLKQISKKDGYSLMTEEIGQELHHLGNLAEKIQKESHSLAIVYKTIQDHNDYLRSQLETYKAYLQNVRVQSVPNLGPKAQKSNGAQKFSYQKLDNEGIICESNVPENRRTNIFFTISTPFPGTFIISLFYKGREQAILEMDLKLDDLLEKQQMGINTLDLEYVKFDVGKTLQLLNHTFNKK